VAAQQAVQAPLKQVEDLYHAARGVHDQRRIAAHRDLAALLT
jgi:hypothetical protein